MGRNDGNASDYVRPVRVLEVPGFRLSEGVYDPSRELPAQAHEWATLTLTVDGGYQVDWLRTRLDCGPASLVFHPPGEVYGARISDAGSRCLTVRIDPLVLRRAAEPVADLAHLPAARRAPPPWLAFELRRELVLSDDLSGTSVESAVVELLAELGERPGLEARSAPPPWLERVRERIHDEFRRRHTLESLARTASVHHVHLAREFRRRFGCTVGQYIRQRRVEFACHRLTDTDTELSRIAFEAGFADQSHFTNTFRRLVGLTPGAFRERFRAPPRRPAPRRGTR